jgi:hypothetical protein
VTFLVSLISGFVTSTVVKALLTRAVVALGLSAVTFTGVLVTYNSIVASVNSNIGGVSGSVGSTVLILLNMAHIPQAFNVILSAYVGALALRGLTAAGAVTKVGISSAPGAIFSPGTF